MRFRASALSPIEISVQALKPSLLLSAYRLASAGLGAAGPLYLYWRGKIGRDDFLRRHERLGRSYLARPGGWLALLHMASGADTLGAKALVEKLGQLGFTVLLSIRDPELRFRRRGFRRRCISFRLSIRRNPSRGFLIIGGQT